MATKKTTAKKEATKPKKKIKPKGTKKISAPANINEALFAFQAENLVLTRNGEGKTTGGKVYRYVTLDDLISTVVPVLQKYGMMFTQLVQTDKMETKLVHAASGTELTSVINLGSPNNMQDYGGRITYAKRYALGALLGVSSEEDIDAAPIPSGTVGGSLQKAPESTEKKPEDEKPADTTSTTLNAPEKKPEAQVQRSEAFTKAKTAIDTAYSAEALEMISGQVDRSSRLTEAEKVELKALLKARDTEVNGTIHH